MPAITTQQRFHRTIRKFARTAVYPEDYCGPALVDSLKFGLGKILGTYSNVEQSLGQVHFFANGLIYSRANQACSVVRYVDIRQSKVVCPNDDKLQAKELTLRLIDGSDTKLMFDGADGNFRDVFEVWRFFLRVVDDLRRES